MTVLVEVLDQAELTVLRRQHKVLGVVQPETPVAAPRRHRHISELGGSIGAETVDQWQQEIETMRGEWERDF